MAETWMIPRTPRELSLQKYFGVQNFGAGAGVAAEQANNLSGQWWNDPKYATTQFDQATGVVPLTVEPLHEWEKTGLSSLASPGALDGGSMSLVNSLLKEMQADPQAFASKYTNPAVSGFLNSASGSLNAAQAPITQQEVMDVANPFTGALKSQLSEAGKRAQAAVLANQGLRGGRSFGDTSMGVRQGMIDEALIQGEKDIDYRGFETALQALQEGRNRSLSAGGQFGNLATGAQGITGNALTGGLQGLSSLFKAGSDIRNTGLEDIQNRIGAGGYVRTYNQGVNDLIGNDILAGIDDPARKISSVLDWLKAYQSDTGGATQGANSLERTGTGLSAAGGLLDIFSKLKG